MRFYETYLLGKEQIENRKSVIVTSETQLRCLGYKLYDVTEFAFDTETNTVDWCNADNPYFKIVGISISFGINDSYYIPIGHRFDPTPQLPLKTIVRHLRPAFERTDVTIVGHNIKYDMHVMKRIGIEIKTPYIFDTMIASWLCNENVDKGLKPNVLRIFNHQMEKFNDVVATVPKEIKKKAGLKANQKATFDLTMIGDSANYATEDAFFTFMLYLHYLEELEITGMTKIYYKMYPPFIRILYDMEERGITIDKEACAEMNEKMQEDIEDLEYQMLELVGVDFDINSSQQLAQLLFGYDGFKTVNQDLLDVNFGFPVQSRTAKGVPQTNNATLVAISRMEYKNSNKIMGVKFCNMLLKYKELSKLKTFTQKFLEVCYPDGKIHCSFNPVGCVTGETLIPTTQGLLPIQSISPHLRDDEKDYKKLGICNRYLNIEETNYIIKFENEDTTKITTEFGNYLEGSNIHPVLCTKYHSIKNNSKYRRLKGTEELEEWKRLQDVTLEDRIVMKIGHNTFSHTYVELPKHGILPNLVTEDLAEFLGIYYADGSLHDNNGTFSVRITNKDEDVIQRVHELSQKLFGVESKTYDEPRKHSKTTYITSIKLKDMESMYQMQRGCINKIIPNFILQSPKSVITSFIKGMTLDSHIIKEKDKTYLKLTVSNEITARYLQDILFNIGIVSYMKHADLNKSQNVYQLRVYNSELIKFKEEIGFIQSYKQETWVKHSTQNHYSRKGNIIYAKVKKIEQGKQDVYDFNVPVTHSFISGSFISHNTDSGRISCQAPNLMQIPNAGEDDRYNIRSLFVGDLNDYDQEDIISCDYSNLEVRVMAHFSKDEGLLNAFEHKVDLHGNTAKLMFRLDCDANEVKKKYPKFRKMGKVIAFLLQYGGSVMALESTLNSDGMLTEMLQELKEYKHKKDLPDTLAPFWGCKSTKEMAQSLMDLYFEAFPGIAKFMKRQKKYAHQHGKVYTVLGRERRLPQIQSSNFREVGYAERLALNAPIQGCQTYDTPILTTKGYKQISELDITKDVLVTHTGVTDNYNVYETGDKEVYKLTTLNTIQKVTLDHRFCVYDNGELIFKRLKELQPGDYIVNGNYNNVTCNNKDVSIHEYIGALIGDGNYSSRNAMRLCGGKDKLHYLHLLKSFVEEHLDYKLTLRQSSGSKGECYEFTTENKQFRELCRSNGLHNASKQDKIIPSWYLTSDVYIKCSLLRGLFNTDGGFSKECLNYTSKSQQVAYSVHLLLNSLGIRSRYKEQKNGVYRVFVELDSYAKFNELVGFKVESKQQRLLSVMDRHSTSYAPINLCKDVAQLTYDENLHLQGKDCALRRKLYTKGGSLSSCIHLLQLCTSSKAQQLLGLIKGITFTKIVTTEYLGVLPTMDIEIFTEDHSYIASGLLNHNSGADIMINAQINIARSERLKELGCKMLVQIHDELLFSCPKENCDEAIKEIRECMIYPFGRDKLLNLALDIGSAHGSSYACGH